MAKPIDLSENNTPISSDYDGNAGKGNCACGGKGCKTPKEDIIMTHETDTSCCSTDSKAAGKNSCCGDKKDSCSSNPCVISRCCKNLPKLLMSLIIASGIALAGYAIGCGIHEISASQRSITVRGFAEQDVKADMAIWNIQYVSTGNDLGDVQNKVEQDANILRLFLIKNGIEESEIIELPTSMVDLMSRDYRSDNAKDSRYIVNAGIRIRTSKVDIIRDLSGMKIGALIKSGVTLKEGSPPVYVYTKLQDVKPEMVAAATEDARRAAEQFAKDANARLGGMKGASQGLFQFLPRDQADGVIESYEIYKTVRVVTSVSYFIKD